jgi:acetoacetyl-CoA reductase
MSRVALVTGGTRGIGAAIAKALKDAGHRVAATFAGNSERAKAFRDETGIGVYQWDAGDDAACAAGVKKVADEIGPVDILVNNAGITRDGWFHRWTAPAGTR